MYRSLIIILWYKTCHIWYSVYYINIFIAKYLGFDINTDEDIRKDAFLFGESQSRIVVTVSPDDLDRFVDFLSETEADYTNLGEVTAGTISIDGELWMPSVEAKKVYDGAIGEKMK